MSSNLTIIPPPPEGLLTEVDPLVAQVKSMIVQNKDDVLTLKQIYSNANLAIAGIKEKCAPLCTATDRAHSEAVALRDAPIKILNEVKAIANQKIAGYETEQKRLRDEADRLAREEQQAERQKVMNAAQAKITRAMGTASKIEDQIASLQVVVDLSDSQTETELAQRQIEILRLKLENQQDKAAAIQKAAEQAADALPIASAVAINYERVKGVKVTLIPEVTDKLALIKAVAEGRAPESIIDINLGMLKKLANMGIKFSEGVRLTEDAKYTGRG
jgi:hypothetical protein